MSDTSGQQKPGSWLTDRVGRFLEGEGGLATPDVTKVQALAIAQAFIAVLVVLGVDLDDELKQTIIGLSVVLGAVLPLSDAAVRRRRAENADKIATARKALPASGAAAPPVHDARARHDLARAELALAEAKKEAAKPS
jgi:hypothetical protein